MIEPELPEVKIPERGFTGFFIPAHIVKRVDDGELSIEEAWLLVNVESLSKKDERGCFASNDFLAKRCGVGERQIRGMISKLKKKGLLIQTAFDGRQRYIKVNWSPEKNFRADRKKISPIDNPKGLKRERKGKSPGGDVSGSPVFITNGSNGLGYSPITQDSLELMWCRDLKNAVKTHYPSRLTEDWKASAQSKHFIALAKAAGSMRVNQVLEWYIDKLAEKKFRPICSSPAQLRKHWGWIEDQYETAHPPKRPKVQVSETAGAVAEEWEHLEIDNLAEIIQRALDQYLDFFDWAVEKYDYLDRLYGEKIMDGAYFPGYWAEYIGKTVEYRKHWNGNTDEFEFRLDHPQFVRSLTEVGFKKSDVREWVDAYLEDQE